VSHARFFPLKIYPVGVEVEVGVAEVALLFATGGARKNGNGLGLAGAAVAADRSSSRATPSSVTDSTVTGCRCFPLLAMIDTFRFPPVLYENCTVRLTRFWFMRPSGARKKGAGSFSRELVRHFMASSNTWVLAMDHG
jgi:hypothetical protein